MPAIAPTVTLQIIEDEITERLTFLRDLASRPANDNSASNLDTAHAQILREHETS